MVPQGGIYHTVVFVESQAFTRRLHQLAVEGMAEENGKTGVS